MTKTSAAQFQDPALLRVRRKVASLLNQYVKAGNTSSSSYERAFGEEALASLIIGYIDKELK